MTTPTHLLNAEAFVKSQHWTDDGRGGKAETYVPRTAEPVRAMVSQPDDADRVAAGTAGADIDARVYLAPDTAAEVGDRIEIVGDNEGEWRVEAVVSDSRRTLKRALCSRRQVEDGSD